MPFAETRFLGCSFPGLRLPHQQETCTGHREYFRSYVQPAVTHVTLLRDGLPSPAVPADDTARDMLCYTRTIHQGNETLLLAVFCPERANENRVADDDLPGCEWPLPAHARPCAAPCCRHNKSLDRVAPRSFHARNLSELMGAP